MNTQPGILGRKVGMTQIFDDAGNRIPVTLIEAGPCPVVQVRTPERDGYAAVQLGFDPQKPHRVNKPMLGHFARAGVAPTRVLREIRLQPEALKDYQEGDTLTVDRLFKPGDRVDVTGTSKGRGFAGVMKRHNFRGFLRTHGTHEYFRHGGAIGTRLTPGHVAKGRRMAGQMGNERVTIQNLQVVLVDGERNLLAVRGGIPGPNGGTVVIRSAVKHG